MRNNDPFSDLIRSIEENLQRDGGWAFGRTSLLARRAKSGCPGDQRSKTGGGRGGIAFALKRRRISQVPPRGSGKKWNKFERHG